MFPQFRIWILWGLSSIFLRNLTAFGRKQPLLLGDSVEKVAMVFKAKKYALEIEICTLSRGFRAQISLGCAQKKGVSSGKYVGSLEGPTFSTESADFCPS